MDEDDNHLKPLLGGDMNPPPNKPRVTTGFFGDDGFSSMQIAEEIEEIIKFESNHERIKVHKKWSAYLSCRPGFFQENTLEVI